jgi:hypothetical protein
MEVMPTVHKSTHKVYESEAVTRRDLLYDARRTAYGFEAKTRVMVWFCVTRPAPSSCGLLKKSKVISVTGRRLLQVFSARYEHHLHIKKVKLSP